METERSWRNMAEHRPELDGNSRNVLETTVSYKARARLTPTLTHVVTYVLVTSGAEDDAMSCPLNGQNVNEFPNNPNGVLFFLKKNHIA